MPAVLRYIPSALLLVLISACSNSAPTATTAAAPAANATRAAQAQTGATARIGDVIIRASATQTSMLVPSIAQQYDITRDPGNVLLLVSIRKGTDSNGVALPGTVTASVTDLRGGRHDVAMRKVHSGNPETDPDLVDYIGTVQTSLPDTLRFDIQVQAEGVEAATLQFSRDFYPQ